MSDNDKIRRYNLKRALERKGFDSSGLSIDKSVKESIREKLQQQLENQRKENEDLTNRLLARLFNLS